MSGSSRVGSTRDAGTTTAPAHSHAEDATVDAIPLLGLALLWSTREPERAGEVALVPTSESPRTLGRGPSSDLVDFVQQRPGATVHRPPLDAPTVSRKQLRLVSRSGALVVDNIGRCPLLVNGTKVDRAVAVTGDVLELKNEALFLVVERPRELPTSAALDTEVLGAFGAADVFGLLGESPDAHRLRAAIAFTAQAQGHVLITGQSGTGKELAARAVHGSSMRREKPFVSRNASTLPPGILDAELFGNAKNYPNPGVVDRPGLIGAAHQGVLFLDEIGELPSELQAHLLRFLDAGEYHRLGEASARRADVRVVGATNRDLSALKHDLVARFKLRIATPPLAERREDIPLLVQHLLRSMAESSPKLVERFRDANGDFRIAPALLGRLVRHRYAGNVRELETLLWSSLADSPGERLDRASLLDEASRAAGARPAGADEPMLTADAIRSAVHAANGNLTTAAKALGISSRYSLYRLMRRCGLDVEELRSKD